MTNTAAEPERPHVAPAIMWFEDDIETAEQIARAIKNEINVRAELIRAERAVIVLRELHHYSRPPGKPMAVVCPVHRASDLDGFTGAFEEFPLCAGEE